MAEANMKEAALVYNTILKTFDKNNWDYNKDEESLTVRAIFSGNDLQMKLRVAVNQKLQIVSVHSLLPFRMSEENRRLGCVITQMANYNLANGSFDYDISDGKLLFRITALYRDSLLSMEAIEYLVTACVTAVDAYNDQFLMVDRKLMTLEQFIDKNTGE